MLDPIELLAREDKWYLGCGDGVVFAPLFPQWLNAPGFWDEATFYQYSVGPLFTVSFLDHEGSELPCTLTERRWTPAELTCRYHLGRGDIEATEVRTVQPGGVFASEWRLHANVPMSLHAVAWTVQDTDLLHADMPHWDGAALGFVRELQDRRNVPLRLRLELTSLGGVTSWSASYSERTAVRPSWDLAPFADHWRQETLPSRVRPAEERDGLLYAAVHRALPRGVTDLQVTFALRLTPDEAASATGVRSRAYTPRTTAAVVAGVATLGGASRRRWHEMLDLAPRFTCSDPYFERCYWHRWYGLWLNAIAPGAGMYRFPATCQGIGPFHQPIVASGPCHVRELRWLADAELARGVFRTAFANQRADGWIPGRIYFNHVTDTEFYHADWGGAFQALESVAPDERFAREIYPSLARYAAWLLQSRDAKEMGMIDVADPREVGEEFTSRFLPVDPNADRYGWDTRLQLKAIDATTYAYSLMRVLVVLAAREDDPNEAKAWRRAAERIARAVRERMWDQRAEIFFDVNPQTGERTGVRSAVGFYPYGTDLAQDVHASGLERTLLDPALFWTTYPVPSAPLSDHHFSGAAEWKGKRRNVPRNGRVWPVTNSHVVDALGRWATDRPKLRQATVHLLRRFIHMMFFDGHAERPNCFEHYNPFTGAPSSYRGIDDNQHSWVADLILKYVCGIRPDDAGITVDPFPFEIDMADVSGVHVAGHTIAVRREGEEYDVDIDGERQHKKVGEALRVDW
ncbi:MAG TPA: trehalase family glycosidase [Gemmatimonadaceae bacterium]|nr:trehalase family glycosidase [Gemmatimonadaceae bacterium]